MNNSCHKRVAGSLLGLGPKGALLCSLLLLLGFTARVSAAALNPSVNPNQGQNGGVSSTPIDPVVFVNGNVNASKGHYKEGQSIPYSTCISGLLGAGTFTY